MVGSLVVDGYEKLFGIVLGRFDSFDLGGHRGDLAFLVGELFEGAFLSAER